MDWSSMGYVGLQWVMSVSEKACRSPIRHVGLRWSMLKSSMGLRSGILVSDGSPIGIQWVFDRSPIILIFSWTLCNIICKRKYQGCNTKVKDWRTFKGSAIILPGLQISLAYEPHWFEVHLKVYCTHFTVPFNRVRTFMHGTRAAVALMYQLLRFRLVIELVSVELATE